MNPEHILLLEKPGTKGEIQDVWSPYLWSRL